MSQVKRLMEQKNELARELIQCKAEIERLKGLIEKAHHDGWMKVLLKDFKTENNL